MQSLTRNKTTRVGAAHSHGFVLVVLSPAVIIQPADWENYSMVLMAGTP